MFRKPFAGLARGLKKTRNSVLGRVRELVTRKAQLDASTLEEIEEILIASDMGTEAAIQITEGLKRRLRGEKFSSEDMIKVEDAISAEVREILGDESKTAEERLCGKPHVIMLVGVNGTGKTTSIGKLACLYKGLGKKVILGAADTYRAAAIEQIQVWSQRTDVDLIRQQQGADPAAVVFDTMKAAVARQADVVLIDTAGRLHTKVNLMEELRKMRRVLQKVDETAPHETLLVLDANTGQNGLRQAKEFTAAVEVSGLVLAKLDGTAKGGIVIAIKKALDLPVHFVGVGEGMEDLEEFDGPSFAAALVRGRPSADREASS